MIKTISSRSRECAEAIGNREVFNTYGALHTSDGKVSGWDSGRLTGPDRDRFDADLPGMSYVVFSYATPIAWVSNGKVYRVEQKFSVTTSKHQGKCYLLNDDE